MWRVRSELLTCLLRLPSNEHARVSAITHKSTRLELAERRKEKKRLAKVSSRHKRAAIQVDDVMLARDMAEGEALVNAQLRAKLQTDTITHTFDAFFTLIKQPSNAAFHKQYQTLMPTIMKGMERFTHTDTHTHTATHIRKQEATETHTSSGRTTAMLLVRLI